MFYHDRRLTTGLPVISVAIGLVGQPLVLALPPAMVTAWVLLRDRIIRRDVGQAAWPSDGFARHVLVDDLLRLACLTLAGVPLFLLGMMLRATLHL